MELPTKKEQPSWVVICVRNKLLELWDFRDFLVLFVTATPYISIMHWRFVPVKNIYFQSSTLCKGKPQCSLDHGPNLEFFLPITHNQSLRLQPGDNLQRRRCPDPLYYFSWGRKDWPLWPQITNFLLHFIHHHEINYDVHSKVVCWPNLRP